MASGENFGVVSEPSGPVSRMTFGFTTRRLSFPAETTCDMKDGLHRSCAETHHHILPLSTPHPYQSTIESAQPVSRAVPAPPAKCVHPGLRARTAREAGLDDPPPALT